MPRPNLARCARPRAVLASHAATRSASSYEQQVPKARCATESLAPPPLPPHARFRNVTCGTRHTRSFRSRRAKSLFVFRSRWRPDFQLKPRRPLRRSSRGARAEFRCVCGRSDDSFGCQGRSRHPIVIPNINRMKRNEFPPSTASYLRHARDCSQFHHLVWRMSPRSRLHEFARMYGRAAEGRDSRNVNSRPCFRFLSSQLRPAPRVPRVVNAQLHVLAPA